MNRIFKSALYLIACITFAGCARNVSGGVNEATVREFESWMYVHYPNVPKTGLGIYVLSDVPGSGATVDGDGYVITEYTITNLEGDILLYTSEETAKKLGLFDNGTYYGPTVLSTKEGSMVAGVRQALVGMKVGGQKKFAVPNWLQSYSTYDTEEGYINESTANEHNIYDVTIVGYTDSIEQYEDNLIKKYIADHPDIFKSPVSDTTGFYYQVIELGDTTKTHLSDTSIFVNYTGRLLNGKVFDTTIERVAKDNGLYSANNAYEPVEVICGDNISETTLESNSTIDGFARTIWHMNPYGKAIGIFYSPLGYSYSGSGSSIPGYCPLLFEIEIVGFKDDLETDDNLDD